MTGQLESSGPLVEKAISPGFQEYQSALMKAARSLLETLREDDPELRAVFENQFFNKDGPRHLNTKPSRDEELILKLFYGFVEIKDALEALDDIAGYMRHSPPKATQSSKSRFLRYHVQNYLNEVYILRERLAAYSKKVLRIYRHDHRLDEMRAPLQVLEATLNSFDGIVEARGIHVHETRFTDRNLDRLQAIALVSEFADTNIGRIAFPVVFRQTRKKWLDTIERNNSQTKRVLDNYFAILYPIVFGDDGTLIHPTARPN